MKRSNPEFLSNLILWAVFLGSLLLSYLGFQIALRLESRSLQLEQEQLTHLVSDALSRELEVSQSILHNIRGLFLASSKVNRNEFFLFTESVLRLHAPIQALGWVPDVVAARREDYIQQAIQDGLTNFDIREFDTQSQIIPGTRHAEYYPVFYLEPLMGNQDLLGLDLASSDSYRASLSKARKTRQVQTTPTVRPTNETGNDTGAETTYLIIQPIYLPVGNDPDQLEDRFYGFAVALIKINVLFQASIKPYRNNLDSLLIELTDVTDANSPQLLVRNHPAASENQFKSFNPATKPVHGDIRFANRSWRLSTTASPDFILQRAGLTHWLILISGCILTLLMTGYLRTLMRRESEIRRLVQQRTQQLQFSEQMSRTIVESAVDAVITIDQDGIINLFNDAAMKMFGYQSDEVIGQNVSMLMPEPYQSEHDGYLRHHQQTGETKIIGIGRETRALHKDGTSFPIHLSVGKAELSGQILFVGTITDLTELKTKEQALRDFNNRLNLATEAGGIGIWDFDVDSGAMQFDDRMFEIYALNKSRFPPTYKAWQHTIHPDDRVRTDAEINKALMGGKHLETEFRILWRDGQIRYIHASGLVLFDEKGRGYRIIGVNLDITDRKRTEEAIELAEQATEAAKRQKSGFMNILSHELRTPLTVIMGYLPLLKDYQQLSSPGAIAQIAEDMETSGQHLLEKINDLLEISRIDAGQMKLQVKEIDSLTLILEMLRKFNDVAKQKGVQLVSDADGFEFHADEEHLQQILIKLIGNAIRFTARGMIRISASRDEEFVTFQVTDTGSGIPESEQQNIFDSFHQGEETANHNNSGAGLGLAITKRLVELHGGTIQIKSKPGTGTSFTFTIRQ